MLYHQDQTNSWRRYCCSFCFCFGITCAALQYPCSRYVPICEIDRMVFCPSRYDWQCKNSLGGTSSFSVVISDEKPNKI
jgi:hypothetical protein